MNCERWPSFPEKLSYSSALSVLSTFTDSRLTLTLTIGRKERRRKEKVGMEEMETPSVEKYFWNRG